MFERQLDDATNSVRQGFQHLGFPAPDDIVWISTPFSGQWGFGTAACFQTAAAEARSGKKVNVPARAAEIATLLKGEIGVPQGFERVEAAKGYLNLYFEAAVYAGTVTDAVLCLLYTSPSPRDRS